MWYYVWGGGFLGAKICSRKEIPLLALSICVSSALPLAGRAGPQQAPATFGWWVMMGRKMAGAQLPSVFAMEQCRDASADSFSCSSQSGLKLSAD